MDVDCGPPKGGVCEEIDLLTRFETLDVKDRLLKDKYFGHLPRFDANGGMHGGRRPSYAPRVKLKIKSPIKIKPTSIMEAKATTNEVGPREVRASRQQGKINGQGAINKEGETRPIQDLMFQL